MKSYWLFLLSHVTSAGVAGGATAALMLSSTGHWGLPLALAISVAVVVLVSWTLAARLRWGLAVVEEATATGEVSRGPAGFCL